MAETWSPTIHLPTARPTSQGSCWSQKKRKQNLVGGFNMFQPLPKKCDIVKMAHFPQVSGWKSINNWKFHHPEMVNGSDGPMTNRRRVETDATKTPSHKSSWSQPCSGRLNPRPPGKNRRGSPKKTVTFFGEGRFFGGDSTRHARISVILWRKNNTFRTLLAW